MPTKLMFKIISPKGLDKLSGGWCSFTLSFALVMLQLQSGFRLIIFEQSSSFEKAAPFLI